MNVEELLADTLQERTDHTTYPVSRYWDVVERAAEIRRGRRQRVLAVASAIVVAVPLAVALPVIRHSAGDGPSAPLPTPAPTHHRTFTPAPIPTFAEIPRGSAPQVAYLAGDSVVEPGGTVQPLPPGSGRGADWAVPLGDGYLIHSYREVATDSSDRRFATLRRVEGGSVTNVGCGSNYLGVNQERTQISYWVASRCPGYGADGALYVADTASGQVTPYLASTRAVGRLDPVGIVGGRVIATAEKGSDIRVVSIGPDGSVRPVPGLHEAFSFDPVHQLVAGEGPDGNVLLDPVTGKVSWSSTWTLNSVSPDGRYVLGISNVGSRSQYALLDASDGHVVAHIHPAGPRDFDSTDNGVVGFAWDHDALLSDVFVGRQNAILRSDISGRTAVATPVKPWHENMGTGASRPTFYGLSGF